MNTIKISLLSLLLTNAVYSDQNTSFLLNLAKKTKEWQTYTEYYSIANRMKDNHKLFAEQCKNYLPKTTPPNTNTANQSNDPCDLLKKFEAFQETFDKDYKRIKADAANTPQARTYEQHTNEKLIID